ncbi:MAG: 3'-5' exoribonuclease [Olsenella sp.]|jgi:DNA polymerase-3 subunit epsilon|nr:3'-5' exoribonuclease [Olsenella sp.]
MAKTKSSRRPEGGENLYALPTSYVAIDTETTGLDFDFCDLIEVGAARVIDGKITDTFDSLIHIDYPLDPFITELSGITDDMLKDAPGLDRVISEFSDFAGDSVLMAHYASFDMNFLYEAYKRILGHPLTNDYVDTLRVARRAFPNLQHRRLTDLCKEFGITNNHELMWLANPRHA